MRSVIVDTRDASPYALELCKEVARGLAETGMTVISGLALGVDSAAHSGALEAESGTTVAVLGSGVDVLYPRQNAGLAKRIIEGRGAVVSEYPIGTEPHARNFPGRNRIISGLSRGVVVVEAGERSGALITADYALEEGRTVFAVPGRVGDPKASGTLSLLKQGAVLAGSAEDVLQEFGFEGKVRTTNRPMKPAFELSEPQQPTLPAQRPTLPEPQRRVAEAVEGGDSPLLDDLIAATGLDAAELLPVLTLLELQRVVERLPSGRYSTRR